jgi:tetratricopeptide (TPR) repeat protein
MSAVSDEDSAKDALLCAQIEGMRAEERPDAEICGVYLELVSLRFERGDLEAARRAVDELLALTQGDDRLGIEDAHAQYVGAMVALEREDAEEALLRAERAVSRAAEVDPEALAPHFSWALGRALILAGRQSEAIGKLEESIEGLEAIGETEAASLCALQLARIAGPGREAAMLERSFEFAKASGVDRAVGVTSFERGVWHAQRGEYLPARLALERAVKSFERASDPAWLCSAHEELMHLHVGAFALDDAEAAAGHALEHADDDPKRVELLTMRGWLRQRNHAHAPARRDFAAAARLSWSMGNRRHAFHFQTGAWINLLLSALHRVRLVGAARGRDVIVERRELTIAFAACWLLLLAWGMVLVLFGKLLPRAVQGLFVFSLLIAGLIPLVAMSAILWLGMRRVRGELSASRKSASGDVP